MMLLTSCQNKVIYSVCPDIVEYSTEFRHSLAEDLKKENSYYIKQSILDYYNLREKVRICQE